MMTVLPWLMIGCGGSREEEPAAKPPARPVLVEPVRESTEALPVHGTALLRRKSEAVLSFKIAGLVDSIRVRAGDEVREGELLAELRQDEIESEVARARAHAENATSEAERLAVLAARRAVSRQDAERAATEARVAAALLQAAEFNRRHSRISAPADGRILRRLREPDELVAAGTPVLEFAGDGQGWIATLRVGEADAARLTIGDPAELVLQAVAGAALHGQVTQIAGSTDPVTRTVEIEMQVTEVPATARSGFLARAIIRPPQVDPRPLVPHAALVDGQGRHAAVFLVDGNPPVARRVPVEIEAITPQGALLRASLPNNELIVVGGADFLQHGSPVDPHPVDGPAHAAR